MEIVRVELGKPIIDGKEYTFIERSLPDAAEWFRWLVEKREEGAGKVLDTYHLRMDDCMGGPKLFLRCDCPMYVHKAMYGQTEFWFGDIPLCKHGHALIGVSPQARAIMARAQRITRG